MSIKDTLLWKLGRKVVPAPVRRVLRARLAAAAQPPLDCLQRCRLLVEGKTGLEIGGPSLIFSRPHLFPIYPLVGRLDNCNFSAHTTWEGDLREGAHFQFDPDRPPGYQYIREAVDLHGIADGHYQFVLSSHALEHMANPLRALVEWRRVLSADGGLMLIVPNKEHTFDHRRPTTTLAHLLDDYRRDVGEDDQTHLPEILALHDRSRDPPVEDLETFRKRSARNAENRCLHLHVFDLPLLTAVLERAGFQVRGAETCGMHHLAVAQKPAAAWRGRWLGNYGTRLLRTEASHPRKSAHGLHS
jgi:SAM-dependent methyltransferase